MTVWGIVVFLFISAFATLLGGIAVVRKNWSQDTLNYMMAFGAGFLLAIAILDLVPEGLSQTSDNAIYILLGFMTLLAFQNILTNHFHFGYETHMDKHSDKKAGVGAFLGMSIHSFFDGFSIVAGFEVSSQLGFLVFVAVVLHKIPDGLTISSIVLTAFNDKKKAFIASAVLSLSTLLGGALVWIIRYTGAASSEVSESIARIGLSFSAGVFLYVAATDLLPIVNKSEQRKVGLFVFVGVIVFYLVSLLVGFAGLE
ncbi:ZIP family metal transporter [Aquibacillus sp. 3ASR75-11]|uniref:ZIP family metal transporter n=1 Tax=Terrihalobacillus insolitus TaxID=2950438 RepID=A0A9X3WY05_9BACI|nr:ZIP family metal transporter [Terrihalobacillus insolitus]MDC3414519.1 ZIP family metal transporter [Terrihalobacillus insolitus]MDC3426346.1 ZIP family metal transporter [Terrihalobacillus insolitus]